jgi:hypothetical protein
MKKPQIKDIWYTFELIEFFLMAYVLPPYVEILICKLFIQVKVVH